VTEGQERILEAAARCALRFTLGKTTIDDIAVEAGVSRATVYRTFPGGRD
jgi:AcrR family transcriptional regulator